MSEDINWSTYNINPVMFVSLQSFEDGDIGFQRMRMMMNEILGMNEEPGSTYSSHITSARWCFYKHNAVLFVLICNTKFCSYNIKTESSLDVIIPQLSWLSQVKFRSVM